MTEVGTTVVRTAGDAAANIASSQAAPLLATLAGELRQPHDPSMEAHISDVDRDTAEVKSILRRLEPVLGNIDAQLRKIESESLPQLQGAIRMVEGKSEAGFAKLGTDVTKLTVDVAELKGRVSQLPNTLQMIGFILAVLVITGLTKVFSH